MGDKDTSTLQSYVDKAAGMAQSALGAVTGSTADKNAGANKQHEANIKDSASHAGTSAGGFAIGPTGVAKENPDRQEGSWDQTLGSAKEAIGGLVGADGLKQQGTQQRTEGEAKQASGELSDLGAGVSDRVKGTLGGAAAGLTGDREKQLEYQTMHDQGKALQRGTEDAINRK
ncbi:hypothetical protein K470DRAFT_259842 [Piedraia hortae CBS 480.64]|uniref:CsbD-like domain-containing protein n=1 Tax=Piedraia hortae CBS 480.64 TaxID=1314780 RepID=A0A6A7BVA9_9PEZI|nr:hypothetical protein K470DRAFT_259842 [Piedraia hortae CBS 480.64]